MTVDIWSLTLQNFHYNLTYVPVVENELAELSPVASASPDVEVNNINDFNSSSSNT